ncbi:hypothetical protein FQZ97_998960 [compost metagenome]
MPKLITRPKACASGEMDSVASSPLAPQVALVSELGEKTPKLKPRWLGAVLNRFRPACLSTRLLNSTTFTSTCTVWLFTSTRAWLTSSSSLPRAASAERAACR